MKDTILRTTEHGSSICRRIDKAGKTFYIVRVEVNGEEYYHSEFERLSSAEEICKVMIRLALCDYEKNEAPVSETTENI